jgi:SagB-type dehydrogenase family enzyme
MTKNAGREFMERTYYRNLKESEQQRGLTPPPVQLPYDESADLIDLPDPKTVVTGHYDLRKAIEERSSVRRYAQTPITKDELSFLLWTTQGVKDTRPSATIRNVPSAGARHAFETYVLANRVEGLEPGLYRFLALEHKLIPANLSEDIAEDVTRGCWNQAMVRTSATTFIWTAVPHRMTWRYQQRSYRYLHLDAGHVCQNLYLAAEAIDCGVCAIAAFEDEMLNETLGLDGVEQFVIYVGTLGKKL